MACKKWYTMTHRRSMVSVFTHWRMLGLAALVLLAGCASHKAGKEEMLQAGPETLYQQAMKALKSYDYSRAVEQLNALEARYPFGMHAQFAQLNLIYANYRLGEREAALAAAERFIKEHPGYIFYVEKNRNQILQNVILIVLPDKTNSTTTTTIHAPRGEFRVDTANGQIILDLYEARSIMMIDGQGYPGFSAKLTITLEPKAAKQSQKKPEISEMTFVELQDELRDLEQRVSSPLSIQNLPESTRASQRRELQKQLADLSSPVRLPLVGY